MSSAKQQPRPPPEPDSRPPAKRARPEPATGSIAPRGPLRATLNPADCDLDFTVAANGLEGHALHEQGFAYCWSGARGSIGITGGKYCFGCKVVSEQAVDMADTPSEQQHVCRVGISRGDDPVGNLGETPHSFGFGGTGKFSKAGKFSDYGDRFGVGDTIVCCVDLESKPLATIGFSKNGKWLGVATQFDASSRGLGVVNSKLKSLPWESALFPHVLLKNVVVQLQFSVEDGLIPAEGYKPWDCAVEDGNVVIGPLFSNPEECEVLMMVGLPASGKTTWAEKWVKEHPEKRYVILGTNLALDQMKVPGLLRKQNYGERFERLMDRATGIFNTLLGRAAKTPHSYILDQTNVYKSARNRKLKPFVNYRKVAVVVFPRPDELKFRAEKRFKEMGKEVPEDAVNEMTANYILPTSKDMPGSSEVFDEVIFTELGRVEAQKHLDEMKNQLKFSSKSNTKTHFSSYSRESSVNALSGQVPFYNEAASAVGGHDVYSQRPGFFRCPDNLNPIQVSPAYTSRYSSVQPQGSPLPINSPYGQQYSNTDEGVFQASRFDPLQSSRDPRSSNLSYSRSFSSFPDASARLSFESPSPMERAGYAQRMDPAPYIRPGAHFRDDRAFQLPQTGYRGLSNEDPSYRSNPPSYSSPSPRMHAPRVPPLEHYSPVPPPSQWDSLHQSAYGSPYAYSAPRPPSNPTTPSNHPYGSWRR